ncbi:MAG TPA: hypothetical protein VH639_19490 [Bryobacteraceae bacterium]|jgi:hypothetical protein
MFKRLKLPAGLCVFLASSLFAQSGIPGLSGSSVESSYGLGNATIGATQYTVNIGIGYNQNLTPGQYISQSQLAADFQGFMSIYPNAADPVEAQLLSVVNSFVTKYPQFASVSVSATTGSPNSPQAEIIATASNVQLPAGLTSQNRLSLGTSQRRK